MLGTRRNSSQRVWYERRQRRLFLARLAPLLLFTTIFLIPLGALFAYSFGSTTIIDVQFGTDIHNYTSALTDPFYLRLFGRAIVECVYSSQCVVFLLGIPSPTRSHSGRCDVAASSF